MVGDQIPCCTVLRGVRAGFPIALCTEGNLCLGGKVRVYLPNLYLQEAKRLCEGAGAPYTLLRATFLWGGTKTNQGNRPRPHRVGQSSSSAEPCWAVALHPATH